MKDKLGKNRINAIVWLDKAARMDKELECICEYKQMKDTL